jgi:hypothetical protein
MRIPIRMWRARHSDSPIRRFGAMRTRGPRPLRADGCDADIGTARDRFPVGARIVRAPRADAPAPPAAAPAAGSEQPAMASFSPPARVRPFDFRIGNGTGSGQQSGRA